MAVEAKELDTQDLNIEIDTNEIPSPTDEADTAPETKPEKQSLAKKLGQKLKRKPKPIPKAVLVKRRNKELFDFTLKERTIQLSLQSVNLRDWFARWRGSDIPGYEVSGMRSLGLIMSGQEYYDDKLFNAHFNAANNASGHEGVQYSTRKFQYNINGEECEHDYIWAEANHGVFVPVQTQAIQKRLNFNPVDFEMNTFVIYSPYKKFMERLLEQINDPNPENPITPEEFHRKVLVLEGRKEASIKSGDNLQMTWLKDKIEDWDKKIRDRLMHHDSIMKDGRNRMRSASTVIHTTRVPERNKFHSRVSKVIPSAYDTPGNHQVYCFANDLYGRTALYATDALFEPNTIKLGLKVKLSLPRDEYEALRAFTHRAADRIEREVGPLPFNLRMGDRPLPRLLTTTKKEADETAPEDIQTADIVNNPDNANEETAKKPHPVGKHLEKYMLGKLLQKRLPKFMVGEPKLFQDRIGDVPKHLENTPEKFQFGFKKELNLSFSYRVFKMLAIRLDRYAIDFREDPRYAHRMFADKVVKKTRGFHTYLASQPDGIWNKSGRTVKGPLNKVATNAANAISNTQIAKFGVQIVMGCVVVALSSAAAGFLIAANALKTNLGAKIAQGAFRTATKLANPPRVESGSREINTAALIASLTENKDISEDTGSAIHHGYMKHMVPMPHLFAENIFPNLPVFDASQQRTRVEQSLLDSRSFLPGTLKDLEVIGIDTINNDGQEKYVQQTFLKYEEPSGLVRYLKPDEDIVITTIGFESYKNHDLQDEIRDFMAELTNEDNAYVATRRTAEGQTESIAIKSIKDLPPEFKGFRRKSITEIEQQFGGKIQDCKALQFGVDITPEGKSGEDFQIKRVIRRMPTEFMKTAESDQLTERFLRIAENSAYAIHGDKNRLILDEIAYSEIPLEFAA